MRLQRINTRKFFYRAYLGEREIIKDERHTGNTEPFYAEPVEKFGNISAPSGFSTHQLFGIETKYSHVLLMQGIDPDIKEDGLIDWNGAVYEITAVRPSLNVLAVALKKRVDNNKVVDEDGD